MEIFEIAAIAIVTALCVFVLRDIKSELAVVVGIAGGIAVIISCLDYFSGVFSVVTAIAKQAGLAATVVTLLFKVIAIGYITEFSSSLIDDMGMSSLAEKVMLAGKLIIVTLSLPVIVRLFDFIARLLS